MTPCSLPGSRFSIEEEVERLEEPENQCMDKLIAAMSGCTCSVQGEPIWFPSNEKDDEDRGPTPNQKKKLFSVDTHLLWNITLTRQRCVTFVYAAFV